MLDVLEDAYWKELANMPEDQRHIDDWDFLKLVAERKITMDYLLYEILMLRLKVWHFLYL